MTLSEWADSYAYLSAESSAEAEDGTRCPIRRDNGFHHESEDRADQCDEKCPCRVQQNP